MKKKLILAISLFISCLSFGKVPQAIIKGKLSFLKDNDHVIIEVYKYGYRLNYIDQTQDTLNVKNGIFQYKFRVRGNNSYIGLTLPQHGKMLFLVRPGDDIVITNKGDSLMFRGIGAVKYNIQANIYRADNKALQKFSVGRFSNDKQWLSYLKTVDSLSNKLNAFVISNRRNLDMKTYAVLLADFKSMMDVRRYNAIYTAAVYNPVSLTPESIRFLKSYLSVNEKENNSALSAGWNFANLMFLKFYDNYVLDQKKYNASAFFETIMTEFTGSAKEKLLVYFLERYKQDTSGNLIKWIDKAQPFIKNIDFKNWVTKLKGNTPGTPVYAFSLPDTSSTLHKLGDFKDKVVVLDFWFTGCGNCIQLLPYLKHVEEYFKDNKNVVFISISTDVDKKGWRNSVKAGTYSSSRSLNLYTNGLAFKHQLTEQLAIDAAPTLKIIDKEGKLYENPIDCRVDGGKDLISKIESVLLQ